MYDGGAANPENLSAGMVAALTIVDVLSTEVGPAVSRSEGEKRVSLGSAWQGSASRIEGVQVFARDEPLWIDLLPCKRCCKKYL